MGTKPIPLAVVFPTKRRPMKPRPLSPRGKPLSRLTFYFSGFRESGFLAPWFFVSFYPHLLSLLAPYPGRLLSPPSPPSCFFFFSVPFPTLIPSCPRRPQRPIFSELDTVANSIMKFCFVSPPTSTYRPPGMGTAHFATPSLPFFMPPKNPRIWPPRLYRPDAA